MAVESVGAVVAAAVSSFASESCCCFSSAGAGLLLGSGMTAISCAVSALRSDVEADADSPNKP